jgi:hypothetical protein
MQIDRRDEQFSNTEDSMHERLEPESNVTVASDRHPWKHCGQSCLTDDGMQIEESDKQFPNTAHPIQKSLEGDSKVTAEREGHSQKQLSQSRSTEAGMQIERNAHLVKA